jgi:hypothetical protein
MCILESLKRSNVFSRNLAGARYLRAGTGQQDLSVTPPDERTFV